MPFSMLSASRSAARACSRCHTTAPARTAILSTRTASAQESLRPKDLPRNWHVSQRHWLSSSSRCFLPAAHPNNPTQHDAANPPSTPSTFYDLFPETLPRGPPPHSPFHIDVRSLRREFLQLQARAHPDLHAAEHKSRAQATSAHLNEAFRTLLDPLLRAQYLLSLRGVDVASDEAAKVADMELLAKVMEAREEIEEAHSEEDLEDPRRVNDERILASEKVLEQAFAADDMEAAKSEAIRLRYWVNIKQCLDDWEPGKRVELQH
ncbi:hypothetical protein jhhlp_007285 [Lomentospora prolificans]|uniref:Co-chaperone HscB C-terminal oligomerisation domain-containing protein n=1 Tax=Lomentospora prolificans TaxID=41688 RepID=A0A2N3N287_9PEZI|nr:hypothetical protein jhhlp_007285 [Lomentospora prolificans]